MTAMTEVIQNSQTGLCVCSSPMRPIRSVLTMKPFSFQPFCTDKLQTLTSSMLTEACRLLNVVLEFSAVSWSLDNQALGGFAGTCSTGRIYSNLECFLLVNNLFFSRMMRYKMFGNVLTLMTRNLWFSRVFLPWKCVWHTHVMLQTNNVCFYRVGHSRWWSVRYIWLDTPGSYLSS